MADINFLGQLDPNLNTQVLQAQQQQALAKALMGEGLSPIQVTGQNGRASPLQALAKVLSGYAGQQMGDQANQTLGNAQSQVAQGLWNRISQANSPQSAPSGPDQAGQPAQDQGAPAPSGTSAQPSNTAPTAVTGQAPQDSAVTKYFPSQRTQSRAGLPDVTKDPDYSQLAIQELFGLKPSGSAKAYQDAVYANSKPLLTREGVVLKPDGNGGYLPDQSSIDALKSVQSIKGDYDTPVDINTTSGQKLQMSRQEAADYYRTGALPARYSAGAPPTAAPPPASNGATPDNGSTSPPGASGPQGLDMSKVSPQMLQFMARQNPAALQNGVTDFQRTSAAAQPPAQPANIQPAGQPTQPNQPPSTPPGAGGSSFGQIGVSQTPFGQALDKQEADRASAMIGDVQNKGVTAIQKVAANNKMIELLPQITTGPVNKQLTILKNAAQSIGVNIGDPAQNQEFDKFAVQGALQAAKQIYGSRITNQDVQTQIASNPGATMSEKAIYQMLQWDNQLQQQHIQKMSALKDYQAGGGDVRQFEPWFAQKYPYQGVTAPAPGTSADFQVNTPPMPTTQPKDNRPPLTGIIPLR
jgi:hypothetical protein